MAEEEVRLQDDEDRANRSPPRTESYSQPILNDNAKTANRPLDFVAKQYSELAIVLLIPVSITVFVVVWGVQQLTPIYAGRNQSPLFLAAGEASGPGASPAEKLGDSVVNALVIVAIIAGVTFLMVCLYKLRCMKIIIAWFVVACAMVFFFLAWIWLDLCCTRFQIPYDWVTMSVIIWNFGVVGMISVFYYAHPKLGQAYLVAMSVIMAWMLARLPEWSTWAILIAVALYDILAVLCPGGPLKMLLKESQERNEPIPGFVYDSSNDGVMPRGRVGRDDGEGSGSGAAAGNGSGTATPPTVVSGSTSNRPSIGATGNNPLADVNETDQSTGSASASGPQRQPALASLGTTPRPTPPAPAKPKQPLVITKQLIRSATGKRREALLLRCPAKELADDEELKEELKQLKKRIEKEEEEEDNPDPWEHAGHASPFKLGLGDFIFYSLLVARAAVYSYCSWMICFLSVLMGLCGTLTSLLFFRGKLPALPALPISIFFATIMYFASRFAIVPYIYELSSTGYSF
jgi:hypothetical protein